MPTERYEMSDVARIELAIEEAVPYETLERIAYALERIADVLDKFEESRFGKIK